MPLLPILRRTTTLADTDRTTQLSLLQRAQTDCLVLAADYTIPILDREKLRSAARILNEVKL